MHIDPHHQAQAHRLSAELAQLGLVLPGTLLHRQHFCGKPNCRCQADPPIPHGPYWIWTRKANNKTITRRLTDAQQRDYQPWFDNARRLRQLIHDLETLTLAIVDNDPRWRRI